MNRMLLSFNKQYIFVLTLQEFIPNMEPFHIFSKFLIFHLTCHNVMILYTELTIAYSQFIYNENTVEIDHVYSQICYT